MAKLKFQRVTLNVAFYRERDKFIAYSAALDLSTCGGVQEQAKRRFEEALQLFLEESDKMGALEEVLLECGWKKVGHQQKTWLPPVYIGQTQEEVRLPCPT